MKNTRLLKGCCTPQRSPVRPTTNGWSHRWRMLTQRTRRQITIRMGMNETPLVNIENGGITIAEHAVLQGVDLTIGAGELVYLIGKTGSGKSSLLKCLYGERASPKARYCVWTRPEHHQPQKRAYAAEGSGHRFPGFCLAPRPHSMIIWILCWVPPDGAKAPHGKAESKRASMRSVSAQKATKCPTNFLEANSSDWPLHERC